MINSKWINEFENEICIRKIILLYGNIYDYYFYNNNLVMLDDVIEDMEGLEITKKYYTENEMHEISNYIKNNQNDLDLVTGFNIQDALLNVNSLRNKLMNKSNNKKLIYIKNARLFFSDFNPESAIGSTHSIHYFNELMRKIDEEDILVVIVSDKLQYFPPAIYKDNPEVAVIHMDYPELEIREEFIKEYLSRDDVNNYYKVLSEFGKMTAGRTLKEIEKILIKGQEKGLNNNNPGEFITYYDFGEKESPWKKLKLQEVKEIDEILSKRVLGQDHAIEFVKKILVRAKLGLSTVHQNNFSSKPIGIFFFVGPTGVGKTELAKALADAVFKSENEFKRFDMSEYKEEAALNKFIGSSPGYVGYEEGGQLTNWVKEHPFSVILFDEIEKANPKIWDTFLQVLEDGRLTDNKGKTVYFNESIIIFTSNIGNKEVSGYLKKTGNDNNEKIKKMYINAVKKYFKDELGRVEILNRIGNNIIPFNHIESKKIYREITKVKLDMIVNNIEKELKCKISYEHEVIDFIVNKIKAENEKFGARAVINYLETYFINEFGVFYIKEQPHNVKALINKERIVFQAI